MDFHFIHNIYIYILINNDLLFAIIIYSLIIIIKTKA